MVLHCTMKIASLITLNRRQMFKKNGVCSESKVVLIKGQSRKRWQPLALFLKTFALFILKGNICLLAVWPLLILSHVWTCLPSSLCRGSQPGNIASIYGLKNSSKCVYLYKPFCIFMEISDGLMSETLSACVCVCVSWFWHLLNLYLFDTDLNS